MLAYMPYMDPMGYGYIMVHQFASTLLHLAVKDQPDLQRIYIEYAGLSGRGGRAIPSIKDVQWAMGVLYLYMYI